MDPRVRIFQALGDETRLAIVQLLAFRGEMNCSAIREHCRLSKSALSYHFRTLKESGLIRARKEGQFSYLSLNRDALEEYLPGLLGRLV